jgi:hypothetical protein
MKEFKDLSKKSVKVSKKNFIRRWGMYSYRIFTRLNISPIGKIPIILTTLSRLKLNVISALSNSLIFMPHDLPWIDELQSFYWFYETTHKEWRQQVFFYSWQFKSLSQNGDLSVFKKQKMNLNYLFPYCPDLNPRRIF